MSFQNEHSFCLVMTLAFSSCFSSFSDYEFKVHPVKKCPMNKEAWDLSSIRLNCNTTHGYHCVPNKFLTSLIEFCYPWGENILFGEGNCLELADTGILNHVPCNETFSYGCPDSYYYGNKIYKYPQCLAINTILRCFESDTKCIKSRQNISTKWNSTGDQSANVTQNILEKSTALVERSTVERNGTAEQTESSTKTQSENCSMVVIILLSILLAAAVLSSIYLFFKRRKCSLMHIKHRIWRNSTPNKEMKIEMEDSDYCVPHYISSKSDTHNYNKCNHLSDEETNRGWKPLVHERESSSQSDPQSFSSPSNDERDSFYKDMCGRNVLANREDSCQSDPQSSPSQFQEQFNQGFENDEFPSVSKRMPKSRRPAHRSRVNTCTNSNPSHIILHHVVECVPTRNQSNTEQSNHQQVPSADEIAACILAQLRTNTRLLDKVATPTTLPGVVDFVQGAPKMFSTENKNGSTLLNEDDTDYSERDDDWLNLQIQENANDPQFRQTEYLDIDNPTCSHKPTTVEMDKEKDESAVGIKKKASKQTNDEEPLEQAKSITSSNSTKTSEQKEEKKNVLSFDNIKDERKKERPRPMKGRIREEEWEIEQRKKRQKNVDLKQGADNIRPAIEKEKIRKDNNQLEKEKLELSQERDRPDRNRQDKRRLKQPRKMERSNARDDWRDRFQRKRSDKRDERDSDRHRARAFIGDSRSELKSERERQGDNGTINFYMETSFSRDNPQGAISNSSLQDDREMSQLGITCYSIPDYLGTAPSSQKNRESSSDSGEVESIWSASRKQINNRGYGSPSLDH